MPSHRRMRGFDRDLIRGGHYGQRSCEPHLKAEHMAAPTSLRLERLPGGACTHWKAPPCHGAHPERTSALAEQPASVV